MQDPAFNQALMNDDPNPLYNLLMSRLNETGQNERQAIVSHSPLVVDVAFTAFYHAAQSNLNADPMSEEVQQALAEQIRRRNVQANMVRICLPATLAAIILTFDMKGSRH